MLVAAFLAATFGHVPHGCNGLKLECLYPSGTLNHTGAYRIAPGLRDAGPSCSFRNERGMRNAT